MLKKPSTIALVKKHAGWTSLPLGLCWRRKPPKGLCMIDDDGNEIRAIGFIAIHAAHLEARIHDLLVLLSPIYPYPEKDHWWKVSDKIVAGKKRLRKLDAAKFEQLIKDLDTCKDNFEWRNDILHSQLFSPEYSQNNLVSLRPSVPPRSVDAKELYTLANNLMELDSIIYRPQIFEIPTSVSEYMELHKKIVHKTQTKDGHVTWPFDYSFDLTQVNCPICLELIKNGE